jgi:hypothetical protein
MPVKDIQTRGPRLSRIGIIRLGVKKVSGSGKEYPADVDHFVLTDAPDIAAAYGDQPRELLIYLPFDDVDENFPAHHELWSATGCLCRGDGERIVDRLEGATRVIRGGEVISSFVEQDGSNYGVGDVVGCPGLNRSPDFYPRCVDCRPRGMLIVMVRDPQRPTQLVNDRLGYYQISTHSYYNIQNLSGQLAYAANLAADMGRGLRGIPMVLRRREQEITYTDSKSNSRKTVKKWLLDLEFDMQWVRLANENMHHLALSEPTEIHALPSGVVVDEDGVIIDEFEGSAPLPPPRPAPAAPKSPSQPHKPNGCGTETKEVKRPYTPEQFRQRWNDKLPAFIQKYPGPIEQSLLDKLQGQLNGFFVDRDQPTAAVADFLMYLIGREFNASNTVVWLDLAEAKLLEKILDDGNALSEVRQIVRHVSSGGDELPLTEDADQTFAF